MFCFCDGGRLSPKLNFDCQVPVTIVTVLYWFRGHAYVIFLTLVKKWPAFVCPNIWCSCSFSDDEKSKVEDEWYAEGDTWIPHGSLSITKVGRITLELLVEISTSTCWTHWTEMNTVGQNSQLKFASHDWIKCPSHSKHRPNRDCFKGLDKKQSAHPKLTPKRKHKLVEQETNLPESSHSILLKPRVTSSYHPSFAFWTRPPTLVSESWIER